jgi:membrane fusion protein, copper/silver efflux system
MKSLKFLIMPIAGLALGAAIGWWAHTASTPPPPLPSDQAANKGAGGESRILYWRDPMAPGQRFDKPGKSPYMDMQLEPVYADEVDSANGVRVSPSMVENLGIRVGKVRKAAVQQRLSAVGSVAFDEHLVELVQARVGGYITRLHVKAPLVRVKTGDPLADITSPEWGQAQQEYAALLGESHEYATDIKAAARSKLLLLGIPESAIRGLERSRIVPSTITLRAPIDGVITELGVREGATFTSGAALFRINGLRSVWIDAEVPEAQRPMISMTSGVTAHAAGWPGIAFSGRLEALLPRVDPVSRTLTVRSVVANEDNRLSPGMYVTLDLTGPASESRLVVPSEAVIMTGRRTVVIVARDAGTFGVANVTTGGEADGMTEILSGLEEGQSIVLSGQYLIDSEASLTATVNRLEKAPSNTESNP